MSLKRKREKDLDGLNAGEFDTLQVAGDGTIGGNLTVTGSINGGGGSSTAAYFSATDSTNQYRATGSTVDIKSSSATPTFRLKNSSDATSSSTLEVGPIQSGAITSTGSVSAQGVSTTTLSASGVTNITNNTSSTNSTTGALVVTGGVGIGGNVHTGGTINSGAITSTGSITSQGVVTTTLNTSGQVNVADPQQSSSFANGAIVTSGGIGAAKNIHSGGQIHAQGTTQSTSPTSGSLLSAGGLGVALNTNLGGTLTVSGVTSVTNNTASSSSSTGALVVTGGTGIGGALNVGSTVNATSITASGSVSTQGLTTTTLTASGVTSVTNNTASTSSSNGALVVTGGVGIGGSVNVGTQIRVGGTPNDGPGGSFRLIRLSPLSGTATQITFDRSTGTGGSAQNYIYSDNTAFEFNAPLYQFTAAGDVSILRTTSSTSTTTGALRVAGGTGIAGNLNVGGDSRVTGWSYVKNASLASNLNDLFINANTDTIYLRPTTASNNAAVEHGTTTSLFRNTSGTAIWTLDKSANTLTFTGRHLVTNNTQATSTTTGAVVVTGGLGIGGNLHVGGTITGGSVSYGTTTSGTFTVTNGTGQTFVVDSTEASTTPTTGAARFKGGVGIEGNLNVAGTITGGSISYGSTSTGTLSVTNGTGNTLVVSSTAEANSTTDASVRTAGGLGVAKNIRCGGRVYLQNGYLATNGNDMFINANADVIYLRPTEASTNASFEHGTTNSLFRNTSGTAIWTLDKSANTLTTTGQHLITNATASSSTTTGALQVTGGVGIQNNLFVGGTASTGALSCTTLTPSSTFSGVSGTFSAITASTSTTTGALVVTGGVGIGGTLNAGNVTTTGTVTGNAGSLGSLTVSNGSGQTLVVNSSEASTSSSTGAVRVTGGVGVGGRINADGEIRSTTEVSVDRAGTAEMRVYNQGNTTEWVFGQRSGSDHNFKITSKVSNSYTTCAEINTSGQLKLGSGNFFGYSEGSWTPTADSTAAPGNKPSFTYSVQYGRYVVFGKQVTLNYRLRFSYGVNPGVQWLLITGIPSQIRFETTVQETTAQMFRATWGGLTNPINTTLWTNGYDLTGVNVFDGLTMTVGAYSSGNYVTAAFLNGGASDQDLWGTLTYLLP